MAHDIFYCDTNSGHEHRTDWEADNCTELFQMLRTALWDLQAYEEQTGDDSDGFYVKHLARMMAR